MDLRGDRLSLPVGGLMVLVGLAFVGADGYQLLSPFGVPFRVVAGGFLLICALGTVLAGGWVVVEAPTDDHLLRLVLVWAGGMGLTAVMATALLHNQAILGVHVAAPTAVKLNALSVGSAGGLLIGYLYTKANQATEALAIEERRLRHEQERLTVLLRLIRHDIRNDMNVVLGWSEALEGLEDESHRSSVERIRAAGEHVVELTELSKTYADVIVDGEGMDLLPVDLAAVVGAELRTGRDVFPHADITLRTNLPDVQVQANELLRSVIRNLVNNAVLHNDAEAPSVDVAVTAGDETVRIAVSDDGPGIADERKGIVFGKGEFGTESEGTGIGLYLVNALVTSYGGSVWVEDNEPVGSTVVVELPRTSGRGAA